MVDALVGAKSLKQEVQLDWLDKLIANLAPDIELVVLIGFFQVVLAMLAILISEPVFRSLRSYFKEIEVSAVLSKNSEQGFRKNYIFQIYNRTNKIINLDSYFVPEFIEKPKDIKVKKYPVSKLNAQKILVDRNHVTIKKIHPRKSIYLSILLKNNSGVNVFVNEKIHPYKIDIYRKNIKRILTKIYRDRIVDFPFWRFFVFSMLLVVFIILLIVRMLYLTIF